MSSIHIKLLYVAKGASSIHHTLQTTLFGEDGNGDVPGGEHAHPLCDYCHHTSKCHKHHGNHTCKKKMGPRLFEEWIWEGDQGDADLCGACACHTDERSLVRGEGGATKALLYTWPRSVGVGCSRVFMEWVEWMWREALSLVTAEL